MSPSVIRPSSSASQSATGIEAAEVLPYWSTLVKTRSAGRFSFSRAWSMIRMFAWCGITSARSAGVRPGLLQRLQDRARDHLGREAEDVLAFHLQEVGARLDRLVAGRLARAAGRHEQARRPAAIRAQHERAQAARPVGALEHDRASAVAEQHAGATIPPVDDPRHHVRADDQHVLAAPRTERTAPRPPARSRTPRSPRRRRTRRPAAPRAPPGPASRWPGSRGDPACPSPRRSGRGRPASRPAIARASREAATAIVQEVSSGAAIRRSTMPVRLRIHSSEVSTSVSISWLSMTRAGRYLPRPAMRTFVPRHGCACSPPRLGGVLDRHQCVSGVNELAGLGQDRGDPSAPLGEDLVEDLHRFDQADDRAGRDQVADGDERRRARRGGAVEDAGQRRHQRRAIDRRSRPAATVARGSVRAAARPGRRTSRSLNPSAATSTSSRVAGADVLQDAADLVQPGRRRHERATLGTPSGSASCCARRTRTSCSSPRRPGASAPRSARSRGRRPGRAGPG